MDNIEAQIRRGIESSHPDVIGKQGEEGEESDENLEVDILKEVLNVFFVWTFLLIFVSVHVVLE